MPLLPAKRTSGPDGVERFVGARPSAPAPPAIQRVIENRAAPSGPGPYKGMTWGPPIKYVEIPPGEAGTRATLKIMKQLVLSPWGHRNPEVVWLAKKIVKGVSPGPKKNYRAMVKEILKFMKKEVAYELDPSGLEYVQTPHFTLLTEGSGDCDDQAASAAALGMALGLKAGFRTVRGDPSRPNQWSHVYAVIGIPRKGKTEWLTVDSTQAESHIDWDPPEAKALGMKTWEIDPSLERTTWHT